jgi:hypothetical protein
LRNYASNSPNVLQQESATAKELQDRNRQITEAFGAANGQTSEILGCYCELSNQSPAGAEHCDGKCRAVL